MIKLNIHPTILTQAIENAGWTKSVFINDNGSLNWYGESDYPSDSDIYDQLNLLVDDWNELVIPFDGSEVIQQVSEDGEVLEIKNPALVEYEEVLARIKTYMESRNV
jgi:hypothetical protein